MTIKANFRPSKTPGFCQCPSYIVEYERPYKLIESDADMAPAALGSALHDIFSLFVVKNIQTDRASLEEFCEKWAVPYDGYMGIARKLRLMEDKWAANMASFFTDPICEKEIAYMMPDGTVNKGTPDVYQLMGEYAMVLDLKTGDTDLDYMAQLKDYALILYRNHEADGLKSVYCYLWNPVIESYVGKEFTGAELDAYEQFLTKQISKVGTEYKSGPFCGYCDSLEVCPQHRRAFLQMEEQVEHIKVEDISAARPIIAAMKKVIKLYDKTEKALLTKHGVIDLGDGHELFHRPEIRRSFDTPKVVSILKDEFSVDSELVGPYLSIKKTGIEDIAKKIAAPRCKGKTVAAVFNALEDGEAVKEKTIYKRAIKRIQLKENTDGA